MGIFVIFPKSRITILSDPKFQILISKLFFIYLEFFHIIFRISHDLWYFWPSQNQLISLTICKSNQKLSSKMQFNIFDVLFHASSIWFDYDVLKGMTYFFVTALYRRSAVSLHDTYHDYLKTISI